MLQPASLTLNSGNIKDNLVVTLEETAARQSVQGSLEKSSSYTAAYSGAA